MSQINSWATTGIFAYNMKQTGVAEFSTVSLLNHWGQQHLSHPLEVSLSPPASLSPSSVCPSFTFLLSSMPFLLQYGTTSLHPLLILHLPRRWPVLPAALVPWPPYTHILTCSHISSPALLLPDLRRSLTHSLHVNTPTRTLKLCLLIEFFVNS